VLEEKEGVGFGETDPAMNFFRNLFDGHGQQLTPLFNQAIVPVLNVTCHAPGR
jgi:hypothetical protein